jgi:hypothetical protein
MAKAVADCSTTSLETRTSVVNLFGSDWRAGNGPMGLHSAVILAKGVLTA